MDPTFDPSKIKSGELSLSQFKSWESFKERHFSGKSPNPKAGQIWVSRAPSSSTPEQEPLPLLVLLLEIDANINNPINCSRVAPISICTDMADSWDFLVHQDESPLGYEFFIELWNGFQTMHSNLVSCLAELDGNLFELARGLSDQHETQTPESSVDWGLYANRVQKTDSGYQTELFHFRSLEWEKAERLSRRSRKLSKYVQVATESARATIVLADLRKIANSNRSEPLILNTSSVSEDSNSLSAVMFTSG